MTLPSLSSVPGQAIPGEFLPGDVSAPASGTFYNFYGHYALYYLDYLDVNTSQVLYAVPGGTYEMVVASGHVNALSVPPGDGRWILPGGFYDLAPPDPELEKLRLALEQNERIQELLGRRR